MVSRVYAPNQSPFQAKGEGGNYGAEKEVPPASEGKQKYFGQSSEAVIFCTVSRWAMRSASDPSSPLPCTSALH